MNEKETGGPAFPVLNDGCQFPRSEGMTLRDWFAGKALMGFMASKDNPCRFHPDEDAAYFYALADAMLKERSK